MILTFLTRSNNFTVKFPVPGPISKTVSVDRKPACKAKNILLYSYSAGISQTFNTSGIRQGAWFFYTFLQNTCKVAIKEVMISEDHEVQCR